MRYRTLGSTGIEVSEISLGAGPVSGLWTGNDAALQRATLARAIELGINWIDTAAGYGDGLSESNLGARLAELGAGDEVHLATKVRLSLHPSDDVRRAVRNSLVASLKRLGRPKVSLFQIHNAITRQREQLPTSLTVNQVLAPGGILDAMEDLAREGLADFLGLTGVGEAGELSKLVATGRFSTVQAPYHLLDDSAGKNGLFAECERREIGVFAIRVLAGGALAGNPPSEYTHRTKFFTLEQYEWDQRRAARLMARLPSEVAPAEAAMRFALAHPAVTSVLVGLGSPQQVQQAVAWAQLGPLPSDLAAALLNVAKEPA
jgi:aryl-alcohol dehydrogenase-like predicted oxidoreductase